VKALMSSMFHSVSASEKNHEVLVRRAEHLTRLLEMLPECHYQHLALVLQAYAAVGTLEYAQLAEDLWRKKESQVPSSDVFQIVLTAYDTAARMDGNTRNRSKAAKRAERLVLQTTNDGESMTKDPAQAKSVAIALHALGSASHTDIPERCERAENLIFKSMGKSAFGRVFAKQPWNSLMPTADLRLLEQLILVYSSHRSARRLSQAQQVLHFMEEQNKMAREEFRPGHNRRRDGKNQRQAHESLALPSIESYRAILTGIRQYSFKSIAVEDDDVADKLALPELPALAAYATGLLDTLKDLSITPDADIYERILKVCVRSMSLDSGDRAEEILNHMLIREICDPNFHVTAESYLHVLRCWKLSAAESHPDAAERSDRLLRSMEAQSGILKSSLASYGAQRQIYEAVYNKNVKPDLETYNVVLRVCSNVRHDESREKALKIAMGVYQRILQAGLTPNVDTYKNILFVITYQTPKGTTKSGLISDIISKATHNGKVDPALEDALRGFRGFKQATP